jgi:hypothetical protein
MLFKNERRNNQGRAVGRGHVCCCCAVGSEDDLVAELRGFWSDDDWSKPNKKRDRYSLNCTRSLARQQQARCFRVLQNMPWPSSCCCCSVEQQLVCSHGHPHLQGRKCTIWHHSCTSVIHGDNLTKPSAAPCRLCVQ